MTARHSSSTNPTRRARGKAKRDDHEVGPFVVESKRRGGRWRVRSSLSTERSAGDYAWTLLSCEGGEVRVRKGASVVAEGLSCVDAGRRKLSSTSG